MDVKEFGGRWSVRDLRKADAGQGMRCYLLRQQVGVDLLAEFEG